MFDDDGQEPEESNMSQGADLDSMLIAEHLRRTSALASDHASPTTNSYVVSGGKAVKDKEWILSRVQVIFQYRWMILGIALLVVGLTGLKVRVGDETYQATAQLNIGIFNPVFQGDRDSALEEETREYNYINTQLNLLKSLPLADRALAAPEVRKALREELGLDMSLQDENESEYALSPLATDENYRYQNSGSVLKSYLSLLSVSLVRKTSLIRITATTNSPELSALIANTHAEKFIQHVRAERQKATIENLSLLKAQSDELATKVAEAELQLSRYAQDTSVIGLSDNENIVEARVAELSQLLTQASARRIEAEADFKEAKSGKGFKVAQLQGFENAQLFKQLQAAKAQLGEYLERYTEEYEPVIQLKNKVARLQQLVEERRQRILQSLEAQYKSALLAEQSFINELHKQKTLAHKLARSQVQYNILKREYESVRSLHQAVVQQLREAQLDLDAMASNIRVVEYALIPTNPEVSHGAFLLLLSMMFGPGLGIAVALAIDFLDNTIKTREDLDAVTSLPILGTIFETELDLVLSQVDFDTPVQEQEEESESEIFLSEDTQLKASKEDLTFKLFGEDENTKIGQEDQDQIGEGAAGSDEFDEDVFKPGELFINIVSEINKARKAGDIPDSSGPTRETAGYQKIDWLAGRVPRNLITTYAPTHTVSESFRGLGTALRLSSADSPPKVLVVTSSIDREGKSFVAANLSSVLTQFGGDLLLIDCDLHRPRLASIFGVNKEVPGLVDFLTGQAKLADVILETPIKGLNIITAGQKPPNPAVLLQSAKMRILLELMAERYGNVILDTPPVLPINDALLLSKISDGVIFVVNSQKTSKGLVRGALEKLDGVRAPLLGVVLNRALRSKLLRGYLSYYETPEAAPGRESMSSVFYDADEEESLYTDA